MKKLKEIPIIKDKNNNPDNIRILVIAIPENGIENSRPQVNGMMDTKKVVLADGSMMRIGAETMKLT